MSVAVGQQRDRPAATDGIEQADAEPPAQRVEQLPDLCHGQSVAPKIREHGQLEQIDRRIPALGVAARLGAMRGHRRLDDLFASHHCSWRALRPVIEATSREL